MILPRHDCIESGLLEKDRAMSSASHWRKLCAPTLVCRDIHNETKLLPWSCNHIWVISASSCSRAWIGRVSAEVKSAIRVVEFYDPPTRGPNEKTHETLSTIQQHFPEVKRIHVGIYRSAYPGTTVYWPEFTLSHKEHVLEFAGKHGWQVIFKTSIKCRQGITQAMGRS